jgi:glycosyltransferase involved in cell wall biosynthesis
MNIGIAECWYGRPQGHCYVIRDMIKILKQENHTIHMYRTGNNEITEEFPMPDTLYSWNDKVIPKYEFERWLNEVKPNYCIFVENKQWWDYDHNKVKICKEKGIKTVGFLLYERLDWTKIEEYKLYDFIICPTGYQTKLMRQHGLYNTYHIPWSVFPEEFEKIERKRNDDKIIFYHCAGTGGVDTRKNTIAIVEAYEKIKDDNTELIITHLGSKVFTRDEILSFVKNSDIVINTSKWDSIGLVTLESNMCGIPVMVVDMPPVNELVKNNINGFTVKGFETRNPYITCPSYNVDVDDLANKMMICKNKVILDTLKSNTKLFAQTNFDWNKNSIHLKKIFR